MTVDRRTFVKSTTTLTVFASTALGQALLAADDDLDDLDLGVASGDPAPDGVVLWTRLPRSFRGDLTVAYELSLQPDFSGSLAASGKVDAGPGQDYCVKVRVEGLEPATVYYYRFWNGAGYASAAGRTKTAPRPGDATARLKIAVVNCQQYTAGYYAAFGHLAREDIDVCVHLGDHIYEIESGRVRGGDPLGGREATTIDGYRRKWRLYTSDPQAKELRRLVPFIDLWDDHEVFNDYDATDRSRDPERFTAAYRAYLEYLPVAATVAYADGVPTVRAHRSLPFGDLAEIFVTDQRQYRDVAPCSKNILTPGCAARRDPARSMLGAAQKAWLKERLGASGARWKLLLSEVMITPLRVSSLGLREQTAERAAAAVFEGGDIVRDAKGTYMTMDTWDGFPAERQELVDFVRSERIGDVVILTGDIHAAVHANIPADVEGNGGPRTMIEIVTASVTSKSLGDRLGAILGGAAALAIRTANPQYEWLDVRHHGYTVFDIGHEALRVRHVAVDDVLSAGAGARTVREVSIPGGAVLEG